MISRRVGNGRITYLGAVLDPDLMRKVVASATSDARVSPEFGDVPQNVEVCRRLDANHKVFVLINHGPVEVHLALSSAMRDVLDDGRIISNCDLSPQGIAVLTTDVH